MPFATNPFRPHGLQRQNIGRPFGCCITTAGAVALLVALTGCGPSGPETYPVSGIITVAGKGASNAAVSFYPVSTGRMATGVTDAEGHYTLTTFEPGDGAPPGKYMVTILATEGDAGAEMFMPSTTQEAAPKIAPLRFIVPQEYSDRETTPLRAEVGTETSKINFHLP